MAGDKSLPWKQAETDREERRDQELRQRREHEATPKMFWGEPHVLASRASGVGHGSSAMFSGSCLQCTVTARCVQYMLSVPAA